MSDETELNLGLSAEQSEIESALGSFELPETAINESSIMYQAGWAAAMADRNVLGHPVASVAKSRFWPALAMTFAATTAACLMVIVNPIDSKPSVASLPNDAEVGTESVVGDSSVAVRLHRSSEELESNAKVVSKPAARAKLLAKFLGVSSGFGLSRRNANLDRFLQEAASPSHVIVSETIADWETEAAVPLTSRSAMSFSGI